MKAKLYMLSVSHPAQAGRLMLEHKGIETKLVKMDLQAGLHHLRLKAAGFERGTVPAVKLDGRKVQGTREMARALDELVPDPPLFDSDPGRRAAIEEAETWGHDVFQPVPRVIARAALAVNPAARQWFVKSMGMPGFVTGATVPVVKRMARASEATPENAQAKIAALPGHIDHVDALIADGVIGGDQPNAADFQIGTTLRLIVALEDLKPFVAGRPAEALAMRVLPEYSGPIPAGTVPAEWLPRGS